jgi:zinc/manganese transport system substrate-binding protein
MRLRLVFLVVLSSVALAACGSDEQTDSGETKPIIVATHAVLGAIVGDVVGDAAEVSVLVPNGVDPHEWEPSAKDVEGINGATLVVANGLNLEESLTSVLENADSPVFYAADHITPMSAASEEHAHGDEHGHEDEPKSDASDEHDHAHDDGDPHFWTDPESVAEVVEHLSEELVAIGLDVAANAEALIADLTALDAEVAELLSVVPAERRVLVTGHVSMAYFAAHYGFELLGSVVPNLSTSAEASAANLAELNDVIAAEGVSVIFAELGAPDDVVRSLSEETGVRVVVVSSHLVPDDNTYRSFLLRLASEVRDALTA